MHEPVGVGDQSDPVVERHNAGIGMVLFVIYLIGYVAFVVINAVWPGWMDKEVGWGLNLAVVYGLGLIVGAFAVALLYAMYCKNPDEEQA